MKASLTHLQIFVLSYLYSEYITWKNHPVRSRITKNEPQLNVETLAAILPSSIIDDDFTEAKMIRQLSVLANKGYIDVGMLGTSSEGFGSFSITTSGILVIKKILGNLQNSAENKENYEKTIDTLDGNSKIKNWLKGIGESLKDKTQDEIADLVLSQVKVFGPQLIALLIKIVTNSPS
jgi:hypothetical protein